MEEFELENGHTVRVGDTYTMNYDNKQLDIPKGTEMTVDRISEYPDGVHIEFTCRFDDGIPAARQERGEGNQATIYAFAMNNLLNDGDILG